MSSLTPRACRTSGVSWSRALWAAADAQGRVRLKASRVVREPRNGSCPHLVSCCVVLVHVKHLGLEVAASGGAVGMVFTQRVRSASSTRYVAVPVGAGGPSPGRAGGEAAGLTRAASAVVLERGRCSFSLGFRRSPGCWLGPLMATCTCTTWTPRKEASAP